MTARFLWNQRNTRGHRPRLQQIRHYLGMKTANELSPGWQNQTGIAKLVAQVIGVSCMSPGAMKRSFVCKRMKQSKMTLSWIVNAGQDTCDHSRPKRSIDDKTCLSASRPDATIERRRASL